MPKKIFPTIVIDGVTFQLSQFGIPRIWTSLLEIWSLSSFSKSIIVLDRGRTAPRVPGIIYYDTKLYDYAQTALDAQMLQVLCDRLEADVFISTYYTTPISTPSVFLSYDMIPEVIQSDLEHPMWKEKHNAILYASRYITLSKNTAKDLVKFFPYISPTLLPVAHCGVSPDLFPASDEEMSKFKTKYGIQKPYFLFVGARLSLNNYKNAILFFKALPEFTQKEDISVVCIGGEATLEAELASLVEDIQVALLRVSDTELRAAYSGAISLIYPSLYEGFGLPIVEAMSCGCPVITCANSSIVEVAGQAVLYVDEYKVDEMLNALYQVQIPVVRQNLIKQGLARSKQFSWITMADTIATVLLTTAQEQQNKELSPIPLIWRKFREIQAQLQKPPLVEAVVTPVEEATEELITPSIPVLPPPKKSLLSLLGIFLGIFILFIANASYISTFLLKIVYKFSLFHDRYSLIWGLDLIAISLFFGYVSDLSDVDERLMRFFRFTLAIIGLGLLLY